MNIFTRKLTEADFVQFFMDYRTKHDSCKRYTINKISIQHHENWTEVYIVETSDTWSQDGSDFTTETRFSLTDYNAGGQISISADMESTYYRDSVFWHQFLYNKFGQEYVNHVFTSITGVECKEKELEILKPKENIND